MSLRKLAGLLAAFGITVGLIGGGVGAVFTDQVTATQNIAVGTFGCEISSTTAGATRGGFVNGHAHSVSYSAAATSSTGSAPFDFTVTSFGTIPVLVSLVQPSLSAPWSNLLADPGAQFLGAAGASYTYHAGVAWTGLDNTYLGTTKVVTWTVNCGEAPYGAASYLTACGTTTPIVNVTEAVLNDEDSGVGGNYWAMDTYSRQIVIRQTAPGIFCATVSYSGGFLTRAGASPNNTSTVSAGIQGDYSGGYYATFTGTLLGTPGWVTTGSVGTVNYNCDGSSSPCPGYVNYLDMYFSSTASFAQPWWGWQYNAGAHGSWINASAGNSGDITG